MLTIAPVSPEMPAKPFSLLRLFAVYVIIGCTGFGPTLAAETKKYLVQRLQWISEEDFVNGMSLAQFLPGAIFVSLSVYIGYRLRGIAGAITSFFGLLIGPFCIMVLLSYCYFTYGSLAAVSLLFKGMAVVVVGVVANAVIEVGKSTVKDLIGFIIVLVSAVVMVYSGNPFVVLLLAALTGILFYYQPLTRQSSLMTASVVDCQDKPATELAIISVKQAIAFFGLLAVFIYGAAGSSLINLGWVFFRMGAFLFGGGFSMIPFIQQEVVANYSWLNLDDFVVGIALGQITPGPVLTIATFVGYKVAALSGAIVATLGIFLPSVFLVIITAKVHQKIQNHCGVRAVLKGVAASFTGMILVFLFGLIRHSLHDAPSTALAVGTFSLLRFYKMETVKVIVGGIAVYWFMAFVGIIG